MKNFCFISQQDSYKVENFIKEDNNAKIYDDKIKNLE